MLDQSKLSAMLQNNDNHEVLACCNSSPYRMRKLFVSYLDHITQHHTTPHHITPHTHTPFFSFFFFCSFLSPFSQPLALLDGSLPLLLPLLLPLPSFFLPLSRFYPLYIRDALICNLMRNKGLPDLSPSCALDLISY